MTGFRPQFWPSVFAVPIVLLCVGLGSWQIQRLFWKERLIAARAAAVAAPPVPSPQDPATALGMEFRHVFAQGGRNASLGVLGAGFVQVVFGQDEDVSSLRQINGGSHPGDSSTDDDYAFGFHGNLAITLMAALRPPNAQQPGSGIPAPPADLRPA